MQEVATVLQPTATPTEKKPPAQSSTAAKKTKCVTFALNRFVHVSSFSAALIAKKKFLSKSTVSATKGDFGASTTITEGRKEGCKGFLRFCLHLA